MGIDTIINWPCEPKAALSTEEILTLLKGRRRAHMTIAAERARGSTQPIEEMMLRLSLNDPLNNLSSSEIRVADLLREAEILDQYAAHCEECPVNRHRYGNIPPEYACIGYLPFPFSQKSERWLLERLPDADELPYFVMFHRVTRTASITGKKAAELREKAGRYFESEQYLIREFENGWTFNSDQAFQSLFLMGHIKPLHGILMLMFYNAMPRRFPLAPVDELKQAVDIEMLIKKRPFAFEPSGEDDENIGALKIFFHSLYMAYGLNVDLLLAV